MKVRPLKVLPVEFSTCDPSYIRHKERLLLDIEISTKMRIALAYTARTCVTVATYRYKIFSFFTLFIYVYTHMKLTTMA
jgi:hypothetical protein